MMSYMSVYFNAPFNDAQVEKLQEYQNSIEPIRCTNSNCHGDLSRAPALFVTPGGLVCPDINCAVTVSGAPDHIVNGRFRF